jgi:myosin heavy subunit
VQGLLNCAQQEKQGCIELLKIFDKNTEEWDEAREDFKKAKSEVRKFMDQLAGLATLNNGKRTADEEITDEVATLHQPIQETVTQEGRLSQMVDFQELENLKAAQAAQAAHDAASEAYYIQSIIGGINSGSNVNINSGCHQWTICG